MALLSLKTVCRQVLILKNPRVVSQQVLEKKPNRQVLKKNLKNRGFVVLDKIFFKNTRVDRLVGQQVLKKKFSKIHVSVVEKIFKNQGFVVLKNYSNPHLDGNFVLKKCWSTGP